MEGSQWRGLNGGSQWRGLNGGVPKAHDTSVRLTMSSELTSFKEHPSTQPLQVNIKTLPPRTVTRLSSWTLPRTTTVLVLLEFVQHGTVHDPTQRGSEERGLPSKAW